MHQSRVERQLTEKRCTKTQTRRKTGTRSDPGSKDKKNEEAVQRQRKVGGGGERERIKKEMIRERKRERS